VKEAVMVYKKKKYISWFLKTYRLKRPESARILHFLRKRDHLLLNTHFVENVRRLPNAIIISAHNAPTVSFLCRLKNVYYENIDEVIACLENDPPDDLYVWLSFDRDVLCSMCESVLEVKPSIRDKIFYWQVVSDLELELNNHIWAKEERKIRLLEKIDEALDRRDRSRFLNLSALYKQLLE